MNINLEFDREEDGRWIAEAPDLPGVMAYGQNREEAAARAQALALRVIADRLENGDFTPVQPAGFTVSFHEQVAVS